MIAGISVVAAIAICALVYMGMGAWVSAIEAADLAQDAADCDITDCGQ